VFSIIPGLTKKLSSSGWNLRTESTGQQI